MVDDRKRPCTVSSSWQRGLVEKKEAGQWQRAADEVPQPPITGAHDRGPEQSPTTSSAPSTSPPPSPSTPLILMNTAPLKRELSIRVALAPQGGLMGMGMGGVDVVSQARGRRAGEGEGEDAGGEPRAGIAGEAGQRLESRDSVGKTRGQRERWRVSAVDVCGWRLGGGVDAGEVRVESVSPVSV